MKLSILFDSRATYSFISSSLVAYSGIPVVRARNRWKLELASGSRVNTNIVAPNCKIQMKYFTTLANLRVIPLGSYDIVLGMDWLEKHQVVMDCKDKSINCFDDSRITRVIVGIKRPISLRTILAKQLARCA